MSNRLFLKKAVIAFGVVALLGASAGAQAWDGYADRDDGRHAEVRHDWRKLHHDRQSRDYFDARARQAAYYGDYRAAHRFHRIAVHKQREVQWDRHDLARDHYPGW
jgi:hypothetical protein